MTLGQFQDRQQWWEYPWGGPQVWAVRVSGRKVALSCAKQLNGWAWYYLKSYFVSLHKPIEYKRLFLQEHNLS